MKQYINYCTEEQTRRAFKLGASLELVIVQNGDKEIWYTLQKEDPDWQDCDAYYIPTTQQMINWLREKGITDLHIYTSVDNRYRYAFIVNRQIHGLTDYYNLYIEAELAAIDAALDYLDKGETK